MSLLLPTCICGSDEAVLSTVKSMQLLTCKHCGTSRYATSATRWQYEQQYQKEYHESSTRHEGCVPYAERYAHDYSIARIRWEKYQSVLSSKFEGIARALDVGCANGAFVDYLLSMGVDAYGVDMNPDLARPPRVFHGGIPVIREYFNIRFDLVTYHDVLEHLADPADSLREAHETMRIGGVLVVDVPDVGVVEGSHHYKEEHLWYFTAASLSRLLLDAHFDVLSYDKPIPGKLVFYAQARP